MNTIEIVSATKTFLEEILGQDRSYAITKMFSVSQENTENKMLFTIEEIDLPEPLEFESKIYTGAAGCIELVDDKGSVILVARMNGTTIGYCQAHWREKTYGSRLIIDGIFAVTASRGLGVAIKLLDEMKKRAHERQDCLGISAEMDTTKYGAVKTLLKNGFVFSGFESYIWHNEAPTKFSKEVLYFYYPIEGRKR